MKSGQKAIYSETTADYLPTYFYTAALLHDTPPPFLTVQEHTSHNQQGTHAVPSFQAAESLVW